MSKKIRVGIIGCGSITKHRHAPEYAANQAVEIVAFHDRHPERAEAMKEVYGGKVYATLEELLADKTIDAVSVCTANKYHAPISIAALQAGKHVLCEKPMAVTTEEGKAMIAAAEKAGKCLMIGHNQRLAPAHVRAIGMLRAGEIGRILTFHTKFVHGGPESWSIERLNTWFFNKEEAVLGTMGDLGVHKADLIRCLLGEEITEASGFITTTDKKGADGKLIEVDDNAVCVLRAESGITGTLTASWTSYGGNSNATVLYGTEGTMRIYDDETYQIIVDKKNGEKAYFKVGQIQTNEKQFSTGVIDAFVSSILENRKPEISGEEGLKALNIVLACMKSSETGKSVQVAC